MRTRWIVLGGFALAGALVWYAVGGTDPVRAHACFADVGETRVEVDLEQAKWSALMAAEAHARELPARATTIAIATAYQESKIHNIDYGDRDSVGLFQQRPSQGWGSVEQILDPVFSIGAFYDALVKVPGYTEMEITDAAQAVQRSGFPLAYADHEADARVLASSLRGQSPAAFWCEIDPQTGGSPDAVIAMFEDGFGALDATTADGQVHVNVGGDDIAAWTHAHYAVANAYELGLASVAYSGLVWHADASDDGWVEDEAVGRDAVVLTLN